MNCLDCGNLARHAVQVRDIFGLTYLCCVHHLERGGKASAARAGDRTSHSCL